MLIRVTTYDNQGGLIFSKWNDVLEEIGRFVPESSVVKVKECNRRGIADVDVHVLHRSEVK